ncbi:MAG: HD-GYP domain-containing protein [Candidatus Marinimicrobia bacterium]|nr:HD-GYP domain-containing protein [Candidatus Neomarinimicrobiota bacterium]MCF7880554.1 HD-GYP domain-containing protein [Candidatus Neomarinimicrobiota bacterium]
MPYLPIEDVKPGSYLGHTIFSESGSVLLNKGVELSDSFIRKLHMRGYKSLYVQESPEDEVEMQDVVSPQVRNKAVMSLRETFTTVSKHGHSRKKWQESTKKLDDLSWEILEDLENQSSLKADLINLKCVNEYTLEHSVNVGIMSGYLGMESGLNMKQVREIIKSGIYHDIGKTFVKNDILEKPASLTEDEMEEIRKHPKTGFRMLMNQYNMSPMISIGSHLHHERWDGSGYPNGMAGEEIHIYGRIVSIIDVFDAMTSDRVYHRAQGNDVVLAHIESLSGTEFDPMLVDILSAIIYPYPTGTKVALSNRTTAIVVTNHPKTPQMPTVKVVKPETQAGLIYELAQHQDEIEITTALHSSLPESAGEIHG